MQAPESANQAPYGRGRGGEDSEKSILRVRCSCCFFAFISCAASKRYIAIKEPDVIYEYGKGKFEVYPDDILEIIDIKAYRGGTGICWKVKKLETGEYGYVSAKRMNERHEVYTREKQDLR